MRDDDARREYVEVNPAARRDRPGEPHQDLADREPDPDEPEVKPHQSEPLDPLGPGGIGG